ncbi:MAG: CvpA family protein [Eubacteriales bacterium]|nr:CvpA family protein [Eubacteriales bacterium]
MFLDLFLLFCLAFFVVKGWRKGFKYNLALLIITLLATFFALALAPALSTVLRAWLIEHGLMTRISQSTKALLQWFQAGKDAPQASVLEFAFVAVSASQSSNLLLLQKLIGGASVPPIVESEINSVLLFYFARAAAFLIILNIIRAVLVLFLKLLTKLFDKLTGVSLGPRLNGVLCGIFRFAIFLLIFSPLVYSLLAIWPALGPFLDDSFALTVIWQIPILKSFIKLLFAALS